ncbi:MAG: hypothetical protein P4L51_20990 [Puia sp.]|nr:hypothetical protein [Puia sp.]
MDRHFLLTVVILFGAFSARPQDMKIVRLKQQKMAARPAGYFVDSVKDDRSDTSDIGSVRASLLSKKMASINLPGGTAGGLRQFLRDNLVQDTVHRLPLTLHISRFEVAEQTGGFHSELEVTLTLAFFAKGNKLVEYSINSSVNAGADAFKYIEGLIRQNLDTIFFQFDKWFLKNSKDVLVSLRGPSVVVNVLFAKEAPDTGMILFSRKTPLSLDDFRGKPDSYLPAAAATYSGIDLKYDSETKYGQTRLSVTITSFFDRNRSWCRTASRNEATLQHEQHHFDITAVKACELAEAIRAGAFRSADYVKEIDRLYTAKQAETEKMQDQYDNETRHGQIAAEQEKWNTMVGNLLSQQSCY